MFHKTGGAFVLCLVLALTHVESIYGCSDYGHELCIYVKSSRVGTVGSGRSCSENTDQLIVNVNGAEKYYHCKLRYLAARAMEGGIPQPPPPTRGAVATDVESEFTARILAALGLKTNQANAQSCDFEDGDRLCVFIKEGYQEQWYCSDQSDVYELEVIRNGVKEYTCY